MDSRELSVAMTLVLPVLLWVDLFAWVEVLGDAPDVVVWRHLLDEIDQHRQVSDGLWKPYPAGSQVFV